jgi:hypothetical protein
MRKAVQPVPVLHDAFAFHIVKHFPYLLGRKLVMVEKRNKTDDGLLEINIVFPKSIVGVDEKCLGKQAGSSLPLAQICGDAPGWS